MQGERSHEEQENEKEFLVGETARLLEFEKNSQSHLLGRADVDSQQLQKLLAQRKARRIARIIKAVEQAERAAATQENLKQLDELFPGMSLAETNNASTHHHNNDKHRKQPRDRGSTFSPSGSPTSPKGERKKSAGSAIAGFTRRASSSREKKIPSNRNNKKLQNEAKIRIATPSSREGSELLEHDGLDLNRSDYTLKEGETAKEEWSEISLDEESIMATLRKRDKNKSPPVSPKAERVKDTDYLPLNDESTDFSEAPTDSTITGLTDIPPSWQKECMLSPFSLRTYFLLFYFLIRSHSSFHGY